MPLIASTAYANTGMHRGMHDGCGTNCVHGTHGMMSPASIPQEYKPIFNANTQLYNAMETGEIKKIQTEAKNVLKAINELKDSALKQRMQRAERFLTFMTKSNNYRELRTAYRVVERSLSPHGGCRRGLRVPSLYVSSAEYRAVQDAELVYNQLEASLYNGTEATVNDRIKSLMNILKEIKNPALRDYVDAANTALSKMYNAKTLVAKLQEIQSVRLSMAPLLRIPAEKVA